MVQGLMQACALALALASPQAATAHCNDGSCSREEEDAPALLQVNTAGVPVRHLGGAGADWSVVHTAQGQKVKVPKNDQLSDWLDEKVSDQQMAENEYWIAPGTLKSRAPRPPAKGHKELKEPRVLRMGKHGKPIELTLDTIRLDLPWIQEGLYVYSRGYNGGFPGPTMRVKAGEQLAISLHNKLFNYDPTCDYGFLGAIGLPFNPKQICMLNSTNLHTHGLHVSPKSNADNMFLQVAPGMTQNFSMKIEPDHLPGTHWYHPHHHHSVSAQAGGGSFGALIVDDPPNSLPPQIQNIPEKLLVLAYIDFNTMLRLEAWGVGNLGWGFTEKQANKMAGEWKENPQHMWVAKNSNPNAKPVDLTEAAPVVLVNGQYVPKMTVFPGQWYRLRVVYAAVEVSMILSMNSTENNAAHCELQLLGKDGIYLMQAPRKIDKIYLGSGNRADVAIRCTCPRGDSCSSAVHWQGLHSVIGLGPLAPNLAAEFNGPLVKVAVSRNARPKRSQVNTAKKLPSFSTHRPCYLVDLRKANIPRRNKHSLQLPMGGLAQYAKSLATGGTLKETFSLMIKWDGQGQTFTTIDPLSPPLAQINLGEAYELDLTGIKYHPLHIHVQPFQIVEGAMGMNVDLKLGRYFENGDWHDVLLSPGLNTGKVRMQVERFNGKLLIHCHILEHEDNGMMAYINVVGKEGTIWPEAKRMDPTCYRSTPPKPGFTLL